MAATEGYATKETLSVFSHARELLGAGGAPTERMTVLWGAYLAHGMRAEHAAALEVAHQLLRIRLSTPVCPHWGTGSWARL